MRSVNRIDVRPRAYDSDRIVASSATVGRPFAPGGVPPGALACRCPSDRCFKLSLRSTPTGCAVDATKGTTMQYPTNPDPRWSGSGTPVEGAACTDEEWAGRLRNRRSPPSGGVCTSSRTPSASLRSLSSGRCRHACSPNMSAGTAGLHARPSRPARRAVARRGTSARRNVPCCPVKGNCSDPDPEPDDAAGDAAGEPLPCSGAAVDRGWSVMRVSADQHLAARARVQELVARRDRRGERDEDGRTHAGAVLRP